MISNAIIQKTMEELAEVTGACYCLYDDGFRLVVSIGDDEISTSDTVRGFAESGADTQTIDGNVYLKVMDDGECSYVLVTKDAADPLMKGRVGVCQLQNLIIAYRDRTDKSSFYQNLLLDNMLLVDIHNRATKLHIDNDVRRVVYVVETVNDKENVALELMKSLYVEQGGNQIISVDEQSVILIKDIDRDSDREDIKEIAEGILDTFNTEAMIDVRVSYGLSVNELKDISKSYKEARMALDVGSIFYTERKILDYETLGIGRLIYQLPLSLCEMFVHEVFGDSIPEELDEETLITVNKFFENNLNVSEASRQLYIHRNTLVYRMEKLKSVIGLDMRVFEDALTFKIAMMVVDYVNYLHSKDM